MSTKHSHAEEEAFMRAALRLAKKGAGHVNPNPMVGAVIVKRGKIIGKGYHKKAGLPHAEIDALNQAGMQARGATLYTNLEPCCHFGRTPPCADAIAAAGMRRVVCAARDPHNIARGGIEKLRRAGLQVSVGMLEKEARDLNEAFFTFHKKQRPFVALKYAASLDGKLATRTGDSKWITNKEARAFARNLRGQYQAVIVGVNTVLCDNPHLGTRAKGKKDPLRIILDSELRIPLDSDVLRDANVIIATTQHARKSGRADLEKRGITVLSFRGKTIPLPALLAELRKREVVSILVEGGGEIIGSFLDAKIVDKIYAFYAPLLIGGRHAVGIGGHGIQEIRSAPRFSAISVRRFGDNILISGRNI